MNKLTNKSGSTDTNSQIQGLNRWLSEEKGGGDGKSGWRGSGSGRLPVTEWMGHRNERYSIGDIINVILFYDDRWQPHLKHSKDWTQVPSTLTTRTATTEAIAHVCWVVHCAEMQRDGAYWEEDAYYEDWQSLDQTSVCPEGPQHWTFTDFPLLSY